MLLNISIIQYRLQCPSKVSKPLQVYRRKETRGLLLGTDEGDHFNLSTVFLPSQSCNALKTLLTLFWSRLRPTSS